ncbi:MAG: polyprenol monophosphomannose synthase [Anaerolineales bacterium]|jgi:dolichol-phosphate mannosyltransferase|nr:polyprenol monophosphomannose synthase [Anaerolineales bacterium]HJO32770.1 polyprenol monophosphomannose synthase [Anaerolineales bacterium]|tara:strand:+ start:603 stop:1340 length:738 start_codon:yes stop_codon:yes gene_type:complete
MRVCTVLPTYNESENIAALIERLLAATSDTHMALVVDDASSDGTAQTVGALALRHNRSGQLRVALIQRRNEKGLTSAIQCGIDAALNTYQAELVSWMDCDHSMPPEDVHALLMPLMQQRADVSVGSRWVSGGADAAHGLMARTLSRLINELARLLLGSQLRDYTSGFVAARAEVLQRIRLRGDYGEYCIDFLCRALRAGYHAVEVPYICVPRAGGESKTGLNLFDYLLRGRKYLATVGRLYFRNP